VLDDDRFPLGPGDSVTSVVTLERRNGFTGSVRLGARGLPPGVILVDSVIPAHVNQGNLVLTAAPDARPGASLRVEFFGTSTVVGEDGLPVEVERRILAHSFLGENANRRLYPVRWATVAVAEGSDLILSAAPDRLVLDPGDSVTLRIAVARDSYEGQIEVNVIHWNLLQRFNKLPPGLIFDEFNSKMSLGPDDTEAIVAFRVANDAPPLDDYLLTILGQISYSRVFTTKTAAPVRLTIRPRQDQTDGQ